MHGRLQLQAKGDSTSMLRQNEACASNMAGEGNCCMRSRRGALPDPGFHTTHIMCCSCSESAAPLYCADLLKTGALVPLLDALKQEAVKLQAAAAHVLGVAAANNPVFQAALLEEDATTVPTLLKVTR